MWPGQDALPEFFIKACNQFNFKKCIRMQLVCTPVDISKKIDKELPETNVIQQSHAFLNMQRDAL